MLHQTLLMLTLSAFLSGGGLQGTIVKKSFKPLLLADSLGVDGSYRLEFRDDKNKIRRQMVSREIFSLYDVGDLFDESLSLQEIRQRKEAARARAAAAAVQAEALALKTKTEPVAPPQAAVPDQPTASADRVQQLFLQQDRLPETEGF